MIDLDLRHYDAAQAAPIFERLVDVYLQVYADSRDPFFGRARYVEQLRGHMTAPGFEAVIGYRDGSVVGYAYGFPLPEGTRWWRGLLSQLPEEATAETGRRTFALCEIMVLPELQGQGIGRALHDELLSVRREERATLLAEPDNAAHSLYERWGWRVIGQLRPSWEGAPTYDAMVLPSAVKDTLDPQTPR